MKPYDYLIVGSGLYGATFAYFATQAGKRCLVIDKRPQLGGNLYCEDFTLDFTPPIRTIRSAAPLQRGIPEGTSVIHVHTYGPHIFHTSNKEVWRFVNSIVPFYTFINSPLAKYHDETYHLPFNMHTFCALWPDVHTPEEAKVRIEEQSAAFRAQLDGREPSNLEEQALCLVGRDIFNKLIKEYTEKQWGRPCCELPPFLIKRLPVRFVFDNNYFNDRYQGIPEGGYNVLINGLLKGVETKVNCDFFTEYKDTWRDIADRLVYTGPLDEYFGYKLGRLDWRTIMFKTRVEDTADYQGNAVVNYTSKDVPHTRVIEHKHFEPLGATVYDCPQTVVSEEYSVEYKPGMEPYYPVNDARNNALAEQYRQMAAEEKSVLFGGRLAEYKYYDMAPIIDKVMQQRKFIECNQNNPMVD